MPKFKGSKSDIQIFASKLEAYKKLIDSSIEIYAKQAANTALQQYGKPARIATDAYLDILKRGGKRIRGALVMAGYGMSGGTNEKMILEAARAIEMVHAYILIIDDIQDRSLSRRGGQSAHAALAEYHHQHHLSGDSEHFGVAIALNSALTGLHAAEMIMANLDVEEQLRLNAISILNRGMIITGHGQTTDIMNEVSSDVSEGDVDRVMEWKTAHYTFLNPLHIGMILAGADCHSTDSITEYAMSAGRAFQISDDVLGTFGTEFESGKSPMDDMREGKRTLLITYALKHADKADKNFLIQMLGNQKLNQIEFERCKDILSECGALEYARIEANKHIKTALEELHNTGQDWSKEGTEFLRGLAEYLLNRSK